MMKERILIVEDDPAIARGLMHNLAYEGYEVKHASHGNAAMPMIYDFAPDLIILDVMLPGCSGFDILEQIRAGKNDVHVIIVSAKTNESDKVEGLTLGADDYVSKPFSLKELLARIEAAMRRIRARKVHVNQTITSGDLTIMPEEKSVIRNGQPLKLTPKAMEILIFLARHPNRIYSREALIEHIWQNNYEGTARTIDNFILQIRGQIEENSSKPKRLETVHGLGYRFID
ncbi:MAG: response regulator transcription factor [Proteobacteria bacterium]|nr:response regulator transcription factor [Pseudomonadota bacterium]